MANDDDLSDEVPETSPTSAPQTKSDNEITVGPSLHFSADSTLPRLVRVSFYVGGLFILFSYFYWAQKIQSEDDNLLFLLLSLGYLVATLIFTVIAHYKGMRELVGVSSLLSSVFAAFAGIFLLRLIGFDFSEKSNDSWFNISFGDIDASNVGTSSFSRWFEEGWFAAELIFMSASGVIYLIFRAPLQVLALTASVVVFFVDGLGRALGIEHTSASSLGLFLLAVGVLIATWGIIFDYRGLRRSALWPHLFAIFFLIPSIILLINGREFDDILGGPDKALGGVFVVSALLFLFAIWLGRSVYVVFGALMLLVGLVALSDDLIVSSSTAVIITLVGIALIGLGFVLSVAKPRTPESLASRHLPPQRD